MTIYQPLSIIINYYNTTMEVIKFNYYLTQPYVLGEKPQQARFNLDEIIPFVKQSLKESSSILNHNITLTIIASIATNSDNLAEVEVDYTFQTYLIKQLNDTDHLYSILKNLHIQVLDKFLSFAK